MAKISLPKGCVKGLKLREKSVESQGIFSGNPVIVRQAIWALSRKPDIFIVLAQVVVLAQFMGQVVSLTYI